MKMNKNFNNISDLDTLLLLSVKINELMKTIPIFLFVMNRKYCPIYLNLLLVRLLGDGDIRWWCADHPLTVETTSLFNVAVSITENIPFRSSIV